MTLQELDTAIAALQGQIQQLQAQKTNRLAAIADTETLRLTARKIHGDQAPQDLAPGSETLPWNAEEAAYSADPDGLWNQPEHAYWLRLTKNALIAGVTDPVLP